MRSPAHIQSMASSVTRTQPCDAGWLVDAYGLDYGDAAEVLGVRTGTIGSRMSRARAALRATLEET